MSLSKPQKNILLIFGGTVVNDDCMFVADVLVEGNKIIAVKQGLAKEFSNQSNVEVIDASGRLVIPGGIDPHTHMQLPFMGTVAVDDFYHGTRAALAGGTTMIIDFAIPPKESTPLEAYKQWREWADPKVCCDYGLSMAITNWNEKIAEEMEILVKQEFGRALFEFLKTRGT
uniref:dihydropyrimidinase n=1 Tax=Meloidogyne incognita TaxID=6306 RepID=A0A914M2I9_MELIC